MLLWPRVTRLQGGPAIEKFRDFEIISPEPFELFHPLKSHIKVISIFFQMICDFMAMLAI
jgi:hypothetical protein